MHSLTVHCRSEAVAPERSLKGKTAAYSRKDDLAKGLFMDNSIPVDQQIASGLGAPAPESSEGRFAKAFHASPVAISINSLVDGRFIEINAAYLRLSGYTQGELMTASLLDLGFWKEAVNHEQFVYLMKAKGYFKNIETEFPRKSGEVRHVLASFELFELDAEMCVLFQFQDITELTYTNRLTSALNQIASQVQAILDPERVLQLLGKELQNLGLRMAAFLRQPEENRLNLRYLSPGSQGDSSEHSLPVQGWPNYEAVFVEKRAVLNDANACLAAILLPGRHTPAARAKGEQALHLPLVSGDQVRGVLLLWGRDLRESNLPVYNILASQVSSALENARLFEEVRESREQLRELAIYLQHTRENERARIAREIHDDFGQQLTALKMDLLSLGRYLPDDNVEAARRAGRMSALVDDAIDKVRKLASELRPGLLDDLGLTAALEWQADDFQQRAGIECVLSLPEDDLPLAPELSTDVFRIFQESLTNIARHAQASRVEIRLTVEQGELILEIQDNGIGITPDQVRRRGSLGLLGMGERARLWGGQICFEGSPGQGTRVSLKMPLPPETQGAAS